MSAPRKESSVPSLFSELAEDVTISQSSGVEIHMGAISIGKNRRGNNSKAYA